MTDPSVPAVIEMLDVALRTYFMTPASEPNAILLTHHFPTVWKHARVICILKPGKDRALPLSYRPISL